MTLEVGDSVSVLGKTWDNPIGRIIEVKKCPVLLRETYLVEFPRGTKAWFDRWEVKKEESHASS